jgi:hypothetical protein
MVLTSSSGSVIPLAFGEPADAVASCAVVTKARQLVLTPQQLVENDFPLAPSFLATAAIQKNNTTRSDNAQEVIPDAGTPVSRVKLAKEFREFVTTRKLESVRPSRLLLALDCEMVCSKTVCMSLDD